MEPDQILASTTPEVKSLVAKILEIEKEYQYHQNIDSNRMLTKEIVEKIAKVFD